MVPKFFKKDKIKNCTGSPAEAVFVQAGKKKKGCGENEFLPACSAARSAAVGWEAARLYVSREAKPAKIDSLIEKKFLRALSKKCFNFCGLCPPSGGEPLAGLPPAGRQLVRVLLEMSSNFIQQTPPNTISRLARGFAPRFGGQICEEIKGLFEIN